jgi:pyridoxine 5-phosphate synthase
MPAKLSVNINKYALLRNSRGHNTPDLLIAADTVIAAGAHGVTVHPRLDQRHVRLDDLAPLAAHLAAHHPHIELNVECEPAEVILDMVYALRPAQCTLVPVRPGELTSDHGWDLPADAALLAGPARRLRDNGVRVSVFMDCDASTEALRAARDLGVDRIELYTGPYAWAWSGPDQTTETAKIYDIAARAAAVGLGLNAGHDLDRHNLAGLSGLRTLDEVSIGHAQIVRALDVGTTRSVHELLAALGWRRPSFN